MSMFTSFELTSKEKAEYEAEKQRHEEKIWRENSAPKIEGLAFWVPPLVDVYIENTAYVWHQLVHEGFDLELEECAHDSIGEPQTWLEVYSESGMDIVLMGSSYAGFQRFNFALENGIGVGQPFLLQIGPPTWHRCSYEYEEYDCDYDVEIVKVMPRAPLPAARSIERAFDIRRRCLDHRARQLDLLRALQNTDITQMFIERSNYYVSGGYYSDERPDGKQVSLCSRHNIWPPKPSPQGFGRTQLLYGKDPDSWEKALESLYVAAEQTLGLKKEQLQHLKQEWRP